MAASRVHACNRVAEEGAAAQEALGVPPNTTFASCSAAVGDVLGPDVMKSTKVGRLAAAGGWDPIRLPHVLWWSWLPEPQNF